MGFASGFSAGANAVNSYESRKRQEKLDEQNAALHAERMDEIKQAKSDKQALRDAGAERTTMQGTAVTTGAGDKNLYADPMQAANAAEDAKIEAEMRGQQPSMVNMQAATGITGKMATGHQITTDPVDLKAINGAEAKAGRFQSALEAQGKPMEAMQMSNAVMENKAKKMGLEVAELDFANRKFNTDVLAGLDADPDWTKGAAGLLTKTQLGRLAGMTVTPSVSADGKTVSFIGAGADGAGKTLATLPNTPQGKLQFTQQLLKASPEMKVSWLVENARTAKDEAAAAQSQSNWQANFDFSKQKEESDQKYKQRLLGFQGAQEARAQAVHKITMEDAKIPAAVKMQATSLAKQLENIGNALNKSMAEGQFDPNNAGTVKLMESQAALGVKYSMLLKPYSSDKGVATSDPLGLGAQEPAAKSAEAVKPAGPPARPPARPQVTMAGVAATEPERTVAPSPPSSIERMQAESVKSFAPLAAKVKQADAAFAAVARSGDPVSIARYMQEAQALRAQLEGVVTAKFGNAAPKVMQQLFAQ